MRCTHPFNELNGAEEIGNNLWMPIKNSFTLDISRVWVHTCSLDHKNALNNYISRGMNIFKTEIVKI